MKQKSKPASWTSLALRASKQAGPWWSPGESSSRRIDFTGESELIPSPPEDIIVIEDAIDLNLLELFLPLLNELKLIRFLLPWSKMAVVGAAVLVEDGKCSRWRLQSLGSESGCISSLNLLGSCSLVVILLQNTSYKFCNYQMVLSTKYTL